MSTYTTDTTKALRRWFAGAWGYERDPIGLLQVGVRTYVPALGRFYQQDEVENNSGQAYRYAHGQPTTLTDPSGRIAVLPVLTAVAVGCAGSAILGGVVSFGTAWALDGKSAGAALRGALNPKSLRDNCIQGGLTGLGVAMASPAKVASFGRAAGGAILRGLQAAGRYAGFWY